MATHVHSQTNSELLTWALCVSMGDPSRAWSPPKVAVPQLGPGGCRGNNQWRPNLPRELDSAPPGTNQRQSPKFEIQEENKF